MVFARIQTGIYHILGDDLSSFDHFAAAFKTRVLSNVIHAYGHT